MLTPTNNQSPSQIIVGLSKHPEEVNWLKANRNGVIELLFPPHSEPANDGDLLLRIAQEAKKTGVELHEYVRSLMPPKPDPTSPESKG